MHPLGDSIVRIRVTGEEPRDYTNVELQCYEDFCGGFLWDSDLKCVFALKARMSRYFQSFSYVFGNGDSTKEKFVTTMIGCREARFLLGHDRLCNMITLHDAILLIDCGKEKIPTTSSRRLSAWPEMRAGR